MTSNSNIRKTFENLNNYFKEKGIDNKVLVLDFSHFTKIDDNHCNIVTNFFGFENNVKEYLSAFRKATEENEPFRKFQNDNVRLITNYENNYQGSCIDDFIIMDERNFYSNEITKKDFTSENITKYLKNKVGSCVIFISKSFNNDEAQSIVYITLEKQIKLSSSLNTSCKDIDYSNEEDKGQLTKESKTILSHFFPVVESLLLDEMIHSLYETGLKKERQSTFNNIWHNTNHLLGSIRLRAIEIEKEIEKHSPVFFEINSNRLSCDIDYIMSQMNFLRHIQNLGEPGSHYFDKNGIIRAEVSIDKINIKKFIEEITDALKINIAKHKADTIRPLATVYKRLYNNLSDLYDTANINESWNLTFDKHALYNILIDILVNATKFACSPSEESKPKVSIWTSEIEATGVNLHIRNESSIGQKEWNYWMGDSQDKSVESHLGIRLSKHILDYYSIKYSIPETCIRENGGNYTEIIMRFQKEYYVPKLKN